MLRALSSKKSRPSGGRPRAHSTLAKAAGSGFSAPVSKERKQRSKADANSPRRMPQCRGLVF
jgi:hypothetical protein